MTAHCDHMFAGPAGFDDALCVKGCGTKWSDLETEELSECPTCKREGTIRESHCEICGWERAGE